MSIEALLARARPEIRALAPYSSARMESGPAAIHLDANENPLEAPGLAGRGLNRYPDPQPAALVQRLAELYGVAAERLLIGRGSDEAIDLLTRAFCTAGVDSVLISPPTFGMYAVCARVQGAHVLEVPLDARLGFALDADAVSEAIRVQRPKLVYVCTPNNPTGGAASVAAVEAILAAATGIALVVVDEAYAEYAEGPSWATRLAEFPQLAVLRTLSKAWGLAGARLGCLLAAPEIIALLRRIMAPYPLPSPSVEAALRALDPDGQLIARERIRAARMQRDALAHALDRLPGVRRVWPSEANFLAFEVDDADRLWQWLRAAGIVVRNIGRYPGMAGCLRVSVGTPRENARFLDAVAEGLRVFAA